MELVRESTARAAAKVTDVTIDHGALDALIDQLLKEGGGKVPDVSWSTGGFHYDGDAEAGGPLTAQYVFVVRRRAAQPLPPARAPLLRHCPSVPADVRARVCLCSCAPPGGAPLGQVDCLNFCFWPTPGLEYEHLAGGIR